MQTLKQEKLINLVLENQKIIKDLKTRVDKLEIAACSKSPSKAKRLQKILELVGLNQQVTVSILKSEFGIQSSSYVRGLMQEAAKIHKLHFLKGTPGQESYITKVKVENKLMYAYAEIYQDLLDKPVGTTMTESAIAHRYELNGQELQSVICHLARHKEVHIVNPIGAKGCRRVKRAR